MFKKIIALLVCVMILFSFVACTQNEESQTDETTKSTETTKEATTKAATTKEVTTKASTTKKETTKVENPFEEKMQLNFLVGAWSAPQWREGRWEELELEEKFNVDLKVWAITFGSSYMDEVNMMLSAGDVPDYGFYYVDGKYLSDNGLGRTIPVDMIKQYYPGFYDLMEKSPVGLASHYKEGTDDELYGFPQYRPNQYNYEWGPLFRLDWMENLGYDFENLTPYDSPLNPERWDDRLFFSNTKFTVDEMKEIFRSFTEDDPDGNGEDDTYGFVYQNPNSLSWWFGVSTISGNIYKDPVSGDHVPFYAYTPYRDYLNFMMEMVSKEYVREVPEDVSILDAIKLGKTGYMNIWDPDRVLGYDGYEFPPGSIIDSTDPAATFVLTPPIGENGKFQRNANFDWRFYEYVVGNISDEKLARLLQLLDYSYFGDNWLRYKLGIEGIHYKWLGEPYKSPIVKTDPEKIPVKYRGEGPFGQFGNSNFIGDTLAFRNWTPFIIAWIDWWKDYGGYYNEDNWIVPDKCYDKATMTLDQFEKFKELRQKNAEEIGVVRTDFEERLWNGQIADISTEWELYIEQLYSAGLEDEVEFMNSDDIKTYQYYANQQ